MFILFSVFTVLLLPILFTHSSAMPIDAQLTNPFLRTPCGAPVVLPLSQPIRKSVGPISPELDAACGCSVPQSKPITFDNRDLRVRSRRGCCCCCKPCCCCCCPCCCGCRCGCMCICVKPCCCCKCCPSCCGCPGYGCGCRRRRRRALNSPNATHLLTSRSVSCGAPSPFFGPCVSRELCRTLVLSDQNQSIGEVHTHVNLITAEDHAAAAAATNDNEAAKRAMEGILY